MLKPGSQDPHVDQTVLVEEGRRTETHLWAQNLAPGDGDYIAGNLQACIADGDNDRGD